MSDPAANVSSVDDPIAEAIDENLVAPVPTRKLLVTAATAALPLAVFFLLPLDGRGGRVLATLMVVGTAALLIPLSVHQARRVLNSDYPLLDAIRCLMSGMVLLVVSFSTAYYVIAENSDDQINGIETKIDALYFTVTVLATVGFGDITATGQGARALVTGQMVVNLAILAVALRLLSWALKEREGDRLVKHHLGKSARAAKDARSSS